jgi:hypothetical protein
MKSRQLLPVLAAMFMATSLPAQIYVSVNKGIHYTQTGASTVNPNNPTPYSVNADISGSGLSALIPTGPNQVTPSTSVPYSLAYDSGREGWNYGSGAMSLASLQSTYPNGGWTLEAGGNTWNLSLTGDLYPNAPVATFSAGTWSGSILYLTAAEAAAGFTVTTSAFTTNYSAGNSYVGLFLENLSAENFPTFTAPSVMLNVPGGALGAGAHYLSMDFNRLLAQDNSVGGYVALIGYNANTNLTIQVEAIPEPSTYAAIYGALALAGVMLLRHRRAA